MIEQSGDASSENEQLMGERECVKLKESAINAKQDARDHHQSHYSHLLYLLPTF